MTLSLVEMYQPGCKVALDEYAQWERDAWVDVVVDLASDERAVFMPMEKLRAYFSDNYSSRLNSILCEVFQTDYPPVDPELILRDHTAIFAILVSIGQGKEIEYFAQYEELSDRRLPFDPKNPVAEFPDADNDPNFLERFCEKQQRYCVPVFDGFMQHKRFGAQRLLPITERTLQGMDGSASKYVIKLYRPHNKLLPKGQEVVSIWAI
jgi:hypothetical protein